ncbi:hypothetical protein HYC85_015714 [Camellia sinensis]|uniref:Uncharacterized protein n=1 Tax=Camellia sinensis TaxID=4442 RepID=A0A7J7H192_CAMSI|nr:hypothetical protein HYC85_015714 [Camellia sinensis]
MTKLKILQPINQTLLYYSPNRPNPQLLGCPLRIQTNHQSSLSPLPRPHRPFPLPLPLLFLSHHLLNFPNHSLLIPTQTHLNPLLTPNPTKISDYCLQTLALPLIFTLFVSIFSLCAIGTITYSTYHGFYGRPVKLASAIKSLFYSFVPLAITTIVSQNVVIIMAVALVQSKIGLDSAVRPVGAHYGSRFDNPNH